MRTIRKYTLSITGTFVKGKIDDEVSNRKDQVSLVYALANVNSAQIYSAAILGESETCQIHVDRPRQLACWSSRLLSRVSHGGASEL